MTHTLPPSLPLPGLHSPSLSLALLVKHTHAYTHTHTHIHTLVQSDLKYLHFSCSFFPTFFFFFKATWYD